MKPVICKDWEDLRVQTSETHTLEIEENGYCGRIRKKGSNESIYLSTHTFYGSQCVGSTKILQDCGFNVELISYEDLNGREQNA